MSLITKTKTYVDSDPIIYSDLNANWDALYNLVNGNLDDTNIVSGANINPLKIAGGAVTLINNQTIAGIKTFSSVPVFPAATVTGANLNTQTVQDVVAGQTSENANVWTNRHTKAITPTGATVKIKLCGVGTAQATGDLQIRIKNGSTVLYTLTGDFTASTHPISIEFVDFSATPNSANTYNIEFRSGANGVIVYLQNTVLILSET